MIKVLLPSNNIGCFAIAIDLFIISIYIDIFKLWDNEKYTFKGIFISLTIKRIGNLKAWYFFNGNFKIRIWAKINYYRIDWYNKKLRYRFYKSINN